MKATMLVLPSLVLTALCSAPALAHGDAMVAVGLPPVAVDVGGVHVVIGPSMPPPPVVVVQEPPPPVVVVHQPPPQRVIYVRQAPVSSVMVYPRQRYPVAAAHDTVILVDDDCDHRGEHRGHHKHHGKHHGKDHGEHRGKDHGKHQDKHHGKHHGDHRNDDGYWR